MNNKEILKIMEEQKFYGTVFILVRKLENKNRKEQLRRERKNAMLERFSSQF